MSSIESIVGYEVLDSRGNPTVEAKVTLASGVSATAISPSGASTGSKEALELRDGDQQRYQGKGVLNACANINQTIQPALKGKAVSDQKAIDATLIDLDGTENKSRLGANAMLAVSMACAKAASVENKQWLYQHLAGQFQNHAFNLPVPMLNILNGGAHADNTVDVQEFMILPVGAASFSEALRMGAEIYAALKSHLKAHNLSTGVGDEGGFAPNLASNEAALEAICAAIDKTPYQLGKDVYLGLDVAATELYQDGQYHLASENKSYDAQGFVDVLAGWVNKYPIISIEDAMDESDWEGWQILTKTLGDKIQLVGDDVFVTNARIFQQGIEQQVANSILIKLNQIGTVSETLDTIALAHQHGYTAVISHRSGESEDTTIADLAVATGAGQIKTGAPCRSDRVAKYNQLLRIAHHEPTMEYAGAKAFARWFKA